jgi:hypothetical protein
MNPAGDPIGLAISEFVSQKNNTDIIVHCDITEDDVIPVSYLFRKFNDMPPIEQHALSQTKGKTLDVGAGAGCHSKYLLDKGIDITAIEQSVGACNYLKSQGINTVHADIMTYSDNSFDTILVLMNGLGIAETVEHLPIFLNHLKSLLNKDGKIICDSSDISYMYQNEDGSLWMDLNSNYYGELRYKMDYKDQSTDWFDWLFIDQEKLAETAKICGLKTEVIFEGENNHYLAELKII